MLCGCACCVLHVYCVLRACWVLRACKSAHLILYFVMLRLFSLTGIETLRLHFAVQIDAALFD